MRQLLLQQVALADAWQPRLERAFQQLGKDAGAAYRARLGKQRTKADDLPGEPTQLTATEILLAQQVLEDLGITDWQQRVLGAAYAQQYRLVAYDTFDQHSSALGLVLDAPDPVAEEVIRVGGTRYTLVNVAQQTQDAIFAALTDARAQGLGPVQTERMIRTLVEGGPSRSVSMRAMRIARTETMHAQNVSTILTLKHSGAFSTCIAYDNRTGYNDADCMARDGQEYTFDEAQQELANEHPNGTLGFGPGALTVRATV